jgi:hypothetical protein
MTVKININSNLKSFTKNLNRFSKTQVPNATRSTLNETAFELKNHIVKKIFPKAFTVRNRRFPNLLFKFKKATKQKLESSVFQKTIDGRQFDVITKSATGGIKKARGGRVAIPTSNIRLGSKGIRANRRPRQILNNPKGFIKDKKIYLEKARGKLQLLYFLKEFVKIRKTFPFEESSKSFVDKNLKKIFGKALAFRISRARIR